MRREGLSVGMILAIRIRLSCSHHDGFFPRNVGRVMKTKRRTKLVHEGDFAAEVSVGLIEADDEWSPYISVEDAQKLDDVREALRRGDLKAASQLAKVFRLTPIQ